MSVKVTVDDHLARQKIGKLLSLTKKSEKEFVKEQTALLCEVVARATPPFVTYKPYSGSMGSLKDRKQGISAVVGDLDRVFSIREEGYINFLRRVCRSETNIDRTFRSKRTRKEYRVKSPLVTTNLTRAKKFYESKRLANGRPSRNTSSNRWQGQAFVTKKMFDTLVKEKVEDLGIAKATFAKAVVKLNPKKRVSKWISKHFAKVNTKVTSNTTKGYSITVKASAKGLQYVTNKIGGFTRRRLQMAQKKLRSDYRRMIKKAKLG
jgi:hypothetical protein